MSEIVKSEGITEANTFDLWIMAGQSIWDSEFHGTISICEMHSRDAADLCTVWKREFDKSGSVSQDLKAAQNIFTLDAL